MSRKSFLLAVPALAILLLTGFQSPDRAPREVKTYNVDRSHSNLGFKVRHLGISNVTGRFNDFEATVSVDPDDLSTFSATATAQIASIDTGIERRDGHLKSDDFFDAENHPTLTFVSKEVRNIDGPEFEVVGDLTIRGTTKELVLTVEFGGSATMGESTRVAFEATGEINRFDYGLQWNRAMEAGGLVVSEKVKLIMEIEAIQQ